MAAKIFRINYKSDFILTLESDAGWMTPFCIKFWTGAPSQAFFVGWDGTTYTHCAYDPSEPTKLVVQFDDHHLPIGDLKFQIAYHFTVADFPNDTEDEVISPANITTEIDGQTYQVMLDFNGETAPEIQFSLPAYTNEAQRIENEQTRQQNEQTRQDNEGTRQRQEATRQENEQDRQQAEQAREAAEQARQAAYIANEGSKDSSVADDGSRWGEYKANEQERNEEYQQAETHRDNERLEAEGSASSEAGDGSRWGAYKTAEAQRDTAYQGAEQERNTFNQTAEGSMAGSVAGDGSRWGQYKEAENNRNTDSSNAEGTSESVVGDGTRWGTYKAAENNRNNTYNTAEGSLENSVPGDGSRWGAYKQESNIRASETGILDVSKYNAVGGVPAEYESLASALAAVPQVYKAAGMSMKFIQLTPATYNVVKTEGVTTQPTGTELLSASSVASGTYTADQLSDFTTLPTSSAMTYYVAVTENETTTYNVWTVTKVAASSCKYMQYRLTTTSWSTAASDWQCIDKEYVDTRIIDTLPTESADLGESLSYFILTSTGKWNTSNQGKHRSVSVRAGEKYYIKANGAKDCRYAFLTSNSYSSGATAPILAGTSVVTLTPGTEDIITIPQGCTTLYILETQYAGGTKTEGFLPESVIKVTSLKNIYDNLIMSFSLTGNGDTAVYSESYSKIKAGNTYRLWIKNPDLTYSGVSHNKLVVVGYDSGGTAKNQLIVAYAASSPYYADYYDFTLEDDIVEIAIVIRAGSGEVVNMMLEDITRANEVKGYADVLADKAKADSTVSLDVSPLLRDWVCSSDKSSFESSGNGKGTITITTPSSSKNDRVYLALSVAGISGVKYSLHIRATVSDNQAFKVGRGSAINENWREFFVSESGEVDIDFTFGNNYKAMYIVTSDYSAGTTVEITEFTLTEKRLASEVLENPDAAPIKGSPRYISSGNVFDAINTEAVHIPTIMFVGANNTLVGSDRKYNDIIHGHKYRLYRICPAWGSTFTSAQVIFRALLNGEYAFNQVYGGADVADYYDFSVPNTVPLDDDNRIVLSIGGRAPSGFVVEFAIEDITAISLADDFGGVDYRELRLADSIGNTLRPLQFTTDSNDIIQPANLQELNMVKKSKQMANIKWTTKKAMPCNNLDSYGGTGKFPANTEVTGLPYSSVKEMDKFIGYNVSFHSFMTAVNNPFSLLYTEQVRGTRSESAWGRTYLGSNCNCYMGVVCSVYANWSNGLNNWQTGHDKYLYEYQHTYSKNYDQSVQGMKIGDIFWESGHNILIAGLQADSSSKITKVLWAQASGNYVTAGWKFTSWVDAYIKSHNGIMYRNIELYKNIDYKPIPFVLIDGETLYNVGDLVFVEDASSVTFYRCTTANSDASFTAEKWIEIFEFVGGSDYSSGAYVTHTVNGVKKLYKNKVPGGSTDNSWTISHWEEVKGVMPWDSYPFTYNNDICTFAGDRASFREGELIVINYNLDENTTYNWDSIEVYKDGVLLDTYTLASIDKSELPEVQRGHALKLGTELTYGSYKARMKNGSTYSDFTYFEVIQTDVSYTANFDVNKSKIAWSSANGVVNFIDICLNTGSHRVEYEPTEADVKNGYAILDLNTLRKEISGTSLSGELYLKVTFKGEYGAVTNEMLSIAAGGDDEEGDDD